MQQIYAHRTLGGRGTATLDRTMQGNSRGLALAFAGSLSGALALCFALVAIEPLPAGILIATTTYCLAEFIDRAGARHG